MTKLSFVFVLGLVILLALFLCQTTENISPVRPSFSVIRLPDNPIIYPDMDARMAEETRRYGYININGPSLVRVPSWVKNPLGKYYLYFAHHKGEYIRLAYADDLHGPWKIFEPGCLELKDSYFPVKQAKAGSVLGAVKNIWKRYPPHAAWAITRVGLAASIAASKRTSRGGVGSEETTPHIASPDVIIDEKNHEFLLYYHGMLEDRNQMSRVAVSSDGINFIAKPELLTSPYLRMFKYRNMYYGISMPGLFNRSKDGRSKFEIRPKLAFGTNMRHSAVMLKGSTLYIFWSRVGDAPERILCSTIDLSPNDWGKWKASEPIEILRPENVWEGAALPIEPSIRGESPGIVNQLRDPAIFEEDGHTYLLYSCAGEQAIAIAGILIGGHVD
jgi:hypothetical protein